MQTLGEGVANTVSYAAGLILIVAMALSAGPLPRAGSSRVTMPAAAIHLLVMDLLYATSGPSTGACQRAVPYGGFA
jgi:hypothetical protein